MNKFVVRVFASLIALFSANVYAIILNPDYTVTGITAADQMNGSSGVFYDWSSETMADTRNPATSITNDDLFNTFAFSFTAGAYVDISFSTPIYNNTGNDLVFFIVGDPSNIGFSAEISDNFGNNLLIESTVSNPFFIDFQGNLDMGDGTFISLSTVSIDIDDYMVSDIFGANALTNVRVNFGSEFNSPGLSLVGGFHNMSAVVVPLPLPIVLFISGLTFLGLVGKKRN